MNALFNLPMVQTERSHDIKSLLNVAKVCSNELARLKIPISTCDHWIAYHVTTKLPQETLRAFEHHLGNSTGIPTFEKLETFLHNRLVGINVIKNRNALQAASTKSANDTKKSQATQSSSASRKTHHAIAITEYSCVLCNEKDCIAKQSIANRQYTLANRQYTLFSENRDARWKSRKYRPSKIVWKKPHPKILKTHAAKADWNFDYSLYTRIV